MPSIGDLANDVARALYEWRVAVAAFTAVAVVALAWVARRRGWIATARRHPMRTAGAVAVALAVILPVTWYLASPLFIRTSLVEAAPTPAITPAPSAAPTIAPTAPPPSASPTPSATPTPFAARTVTSGDFQGTDDFHFGRGTASIIEIAPGRYHLRLEDFSVRNGPDLYVVLSPEPDAYHDESLELGVLKATDGAFGYDLPAGADPDIYRSALIWCKQFSHLFAFATFDA
jgi:hypothetical protein